MTNDNQHLFLYRALREEEIDRGNILIPKAIGAFLSRPLLGVDIILGDTFLKPNETSAVRQHQLDSDKYSTSGISTTPHLERAKTYAQKKRVIVKIARNLFGRYDIQEFVVKDHFKISPQYIKCPEDDEVILVTKNGEFPKEIIIEVIKI